MSSSKSSQKSTTTNITETVTPTLVTGQGGSNVSIVSESFKGEIGFTGSDAVRVLSDFQDLQRDAALLNSQNFANALVAASDGPTQSFIPPAVLSSFAAGGGAGGGSGEPDAAAGPKLNTAVLLLGGAAAVVTIFALRK